MATPKRDPKTGRFLPKNVDNPPRKSKKKKSKHVARKGGKFAKHVDTVRFYGGKARKDYVVGRLDDVKQMVDENHDQFDAISFESLTEVMALLSDDAPRVLIVWFLYMPSYANLDTEKIASDEPVKTVHIGTGLDFITKITNWLQNDAIIAEIDTQKLKEDDYKPTFSRPLWGNEEIELANGKTIKGTGDNAAWNAKKKNNPMTDYRNPKPPRKRNRIREKQVEKIRLEAQGKKRNKGNVREQKRRAKLRKKQQKETETKNDNS